MRVGGIYKIQSIIKPERVYVGSAVYIKHRWSSHLNTLRKNKHDNGRLQNHYNKYGEQDLLFIIVEPCLPEVLIQREQYYIDTLMPWFNIRKIAESNKGIKFSEESCKRCSDSHKDKPMLEQCRQALIKANTGNKYTLGKDPWNKGKTGVFSVDTLKKMSDSHLGQVSGHKGKKASTETLQKLHDSHMGQVSFMKGKHHSEGAKRKNSIAHKNPIIQFDLGMGFVKGWDSTVDASIVLGLNKSSISKCLCNRQSSAGGFVWKYKFDKDVA